MSGDSLPPVVVSLLAAIEARPDDVPLRLHAAALLLEHGSPALAIAQCSAVLQLEPANAEAIDLLTRATGRLAPDQPSEPQRRPGGRVRLGQRRGRGRRHRRARVRRPERRGAAVDEPEEAGLRLRRRRGHGGRQAAPGDDVLRADAQPGAEDALRQEPLGRAAALRAARVRQDVPRARRGGRARSELLRGLARRRARHVDRLERAQPARDLRGRRRNTPCVLFLDEIDAIGQKRSHLRSNAAMRGTVNQLLSEMDSVGSNNDGVFILGATNHPWDVDTALMRPGRFDRLLLVVPPDEAAREAIVRYHLRGRPLEGIDARKLARPDRELLGRRSRTPLRQRGRAGPARLHLERRRQADPDERLRAGLREVKPSTGPWLEDARNVVMFANEAGRFDELLHYLKARKLA